MRISHKVLFGLSAAFLMGSISQTAEAMHHGKAEKVAETLPQIKETHNQKNMPDVQGNAQQAHGAGTMQDGAKQGHMKGDAPQGTAVNSTKKTKKTKEGYGCLMD